MDYKAQDNLRLLYSEIIQSYYALLFHNQNSILVSKLLDKAKQRVVIIEKRVNAGSLPQIALLEANQQVINRKQKLLIVQNQYENALRTFLKYLNIDITYFNQTYTLPSLLDLKNRYTSEGVSFERALENRPDLKVYANEIQKLDLENKFTSISKYPNFDIGVYGVHDFEYENGFKVTLSMDFPVERRKYTSKSLEIKSSIKNVQKLNEQKIITIKTDLNNIKNSMDALLNNIKNSEIEVELVQKLEAAEEKKYMLGSSNLFMLNQREIYTLEIQKKLLQYNLDYLQLVQESNKVMGIVFEHNL
jgi:outer membrane protein TolC